MESPKESVMESSTELWNRWDSLEECKVFGYAFILSAKPDISQFQEGT